MVEVQVSGSLVGGAASNPQNSTLSTSIPLLGVHWRPRDGRNAEFMLWDDAVQRAREEIGCDCGRHGRSPTFLAVNEIV